MLRRIVPSRNSLKAFAVAGAWFFIVVSLGHLVWAAGHKWSDPAGTYKLYAQRQAKRQEKSAR